MHGLDLPGIQCHPGEAHQPLVGAPATALTGWCTYTGTTSVPARLPVLDTVKVAVTVPVRDTLPVADSPLVPNVVYDSP